MIKLSGGVRLIAGAFRGYATVKEIARMVPKEGKVVFIDGKVVSHDTELTAIAVPKGYELQVVSVNARGDNEDPKVAVKIAELLKKGTAVDKKAKKTKPAQIKEISVSWSISKKDFDLQKRKAIESVFNRGHSLQLKLEDKNYRRQPLTPNQLESRALIRDRVEGLLDELGTRAKAPDGNIQSRMLFYYRPKQQ